MDGVLGEAGRVGMGLFLKGEGGPLGFVFAFRARHSVIMTVGCIWLTKGGCLENARENSGKAVSARVGLMGFGFRVFGFRVFGQIFWDWDWG